MDGTLKFNSLYFCLCGVMFGFYKVNYIPALAPHPFIQREEAKKKGFQNDTSCDLE